MKVPRRPAAQAPGARRGLFHGWRIAPLIVIAFVLGRLSVERPPASTPDARAEADAGIVATRTSTVPLCPCPRPRAHPASTSIRRKVVLPKPLAPEGSRDTSEATAAFLRSAASSLGVCAPSVGSRLRIHIEITVKPTGKIEGSRLTNLDELPPAVADCIQGKVNALEPPGFDATEAMVFVLTVVL